MVRGLFNKDTYRLCLDSLGEAEASRSVLLANPRLDASPDDPESAVLQYEVSLVRGSLPREVVERTSVLCTGLGGGDSGSKPPVLEASGEGRFQARTTVSRRLAPHAVPPCRVSVSLHHKDWPLTSWLSTPMIQE